MYQEAWILDPIVLFWIHLKVVQMSMPNWNDKARTGDLQAGVFTFGVLECLEARNNAL